MVDVPMTDAMRSALKWLVDHGGDAALDRHGIALAQGETAPVMRTTWNRLAAFGLIEFYNPTGKGRGRLRTTANE